MYFSRIRLRTDADTSVLARQLCDTDSYREHQMLWRLFGEEPDARRDFLFRRDDKNGWPQFYLVSQRLPVDDDRVWQIDQQEYNPKLNSGQQLKFDIRANPVITRKDASGRRKRHDLVMDLKKRKGWKQAPKDKRSDLYSLLQEAGEVWLADRLKRNGATLNNLVAEGYQRHRCFKRGQKNAIHYSSLDLQGALTVTDPETFNQVLFQGIGPAKSFGCGLLLVRKL